MIGKCPTEQVSPQKGLMYTFTVFFFVKSRFLATQEELEALLWICFSSWMILLIFEEKYYSNFFSSTFGDCE